MSASFLQGLLGGIPQGQNIASTFQNQQAKGMEMDKERRKQQALAELATGIEKLHKEGKLTDKQYLGAKTMANTGDAKGAYSVFEDKEEDGEYEIKKTDSNEYILVSRNPKNKPIGTGLFSDDNNPQTKALNEAKINYYNNLAGRDYVDPNDVQNVRKDGLAIYNKLSDYDREKIDQEEFVSNYVNYVTTGEFLMPKEATTPEEPKEENFNIGDIVKGFINKFMWKKDNDPLGIN